MLVVRPGRARVGLGSPPQGWLTRSQTWRRQGERLGRLGRLGGVFGGPRRAPVVAARWRPNSQALGPMFLFYSLFFSGKLAAMDGRRQHGPFEPILSRLLSIFGYFTEVFLFWGLALALDRESRDKGNEWGKK